MSSQMILRIDDKIKEKFYNIVRREGKTASEKMREMVESYIKKADMSRVVDDLWERVEKKIKEKGFNEADVERVIRETRKVK